MRGRHGGQGCPVDGAGEQRPPASLVRGDVTVRERGPLVELEDEQFTGRQERPVQRWVGHPGGGKSRLDRGPTHETDQHVGGRVVANGDHLGGRFLHGDLGAVWLILELSGGQALKLRGDGQRLVPVDLA